MVGWESDRNGEVGGVTGVVGWESGRNGGVGGVTGVVGWESDSMCRHI